MNLTQRLGKAWAVFRSPAAPPPLSGPPKQSAEIEAALARLRLDLEQARGEIERLRAEYARQEQKTAGEVQAAAREALLRLARRVGPLLSQFATMRALAAEGREVRREDLLVMADKLERAFADGGVAAVGAVGEETAFNPKLHQRMSGGDVADGDPVRVRFVGYACGDTIVTKAMVSRKE